MKNYLSNLDKKCARVIHDIGHEADRRRLSAYVVGGVVRDIMLKKKDLDLDVSIEGNAIGVGKVLAKKWKASLTIYQPFKTVSLILPDGMRVDLATMRKESYRHSGALPTVKPGRLSEDLFRRDFTINAMAIAIYGKQFGQLTDFFEGLKDLKNKNVRVLHDKSFVDDPTRILRAVRFEQRLGFRIERRTLGLMKTAIKKKYPDHVKPPRYFSEFKRLLREADPVKPIKRLHALRGLQFLHSRLNLNIAELSHFNLRVQEIKKMIAYKPYNHWWFIVFLAMLDNASNRAVEDILLKFPFTRGEQKSIRQCRNAKNIITILSKKNILSSRIYQALRPLTEESVMYLRVKTAKKLAGRRIDRFLAADIKVKLKISGDDLKKIGIAPGRDMREVLEKVLCSKIDNQIHTKREELNAALAAKGSNKA